jgi:hypothetical protein
VRVICISKGIRKVWGARYTLGAPYRSENKVHKINTTQTFDLHVPTANFTMYQKGVCYSGIKIYNHLPTAIKDLSDDKNKFKLVLKRYLLHNYFYSLEEYLNT